MTPGTRELVAGHVRVATWEFDDVRRTDVVLVDGDGEEAHLGDLLAPYAGQFVALSLYVE